MEISREQVLHIARLARLRLGEDEVAGFQKDLNSILGYVDKLRELDTTGVEPTTHAVPIDGVLREDVADQRLSPDAILGNAPQKQEGYFRVPKVVED
ncbi:MAG: Asp-tRNA(Asn)/Glu-tRNA(Gln) amidotransferase subunit GatC [Bradymonadaceae bacterium]|nr:Asp-tRNA(Asn)/Glu-tRNA(Gln) amidotransferase subunit GatC [Lujinxingiaceae bacterium]